MPDYPTYANYVINPSGAPVFDQNTEYLAAVARLEEAERERRAEFAREQEAQRIEDDSRRSRCTCFGCRADRGEVEPIRCTNCLWQFTPANEDQQDAGMCVDCLPCDCGDCERCGYAADADDSFSPSEYVHNYSYRPRTRFHRTADDEDSRLFMGFELEVATDEPDDVARLIYQGIGAAEDVFYCKDDGSISGVEIVSHPMTHAFFSALPLKDELLTRGGEITNLLRYRQAGEGYGLHVHVSRDGFKSQAHAMRWLLLIYSNEDSVAKLARRPAGEWTSFSDKEQNSTKAKMLRRQGYNGRRYVAVNAQNKDTFEVRVFRSTWKEQELRAAVDFCHASVVYTRNLTVGASYAGLDWDAFAAWVADRPQYSNLTAELSRIANESE